MDAKERLIARFRNEFETKNLADVKFFVRRGQTGVNGLYEEADCFEVAAAAGPCIEIGEIDASFPKTLFNAPFV